MSTPPHHSPGPESPLAPVETTPHAVSPSQAATLPPPPSPASATATLPPSPPAAEATFDGVAVPGYEVMGLLGRGGMGVVYKARQVQADRVVALKMILHAEHAGDDEHARFQTEARAIARLQHPQIVQVYEVGEHRGIPFFSLEFCPGGGLDQKLAGTPLEAKAAAALVEKLARAMQAAHQANVIHRDLKPANVLLTAEGEPKLTDFGLAKRLDEQGRTHTGAIMGTPSYMAPEQAGGGKDVGPAADVYALGAILYECLTGRPPFKAATPLDTIMQVVSDEPVPPRLLNPQVERDLETICLKCLAKEPRKRYPCATELAEDLARYLHGDPITSRTSNVLDRLARTLERHQLDVEVSSWGVMLLWFAVIILVGQAVLFVLLRLRQPWEILLPVRLSEFVFLWLVFWRYRHRNWLTHSMAERQLWSVWIGYFIGCGCAGEMCRQLYGIENIFQSPLYPFCTLFAGLSFFALGSNYWGQCYLIGLAFFGLSIVMVWNLDWAPLEFGLLWALTLGAIGLRLHRLGAARNAGK
jgi:tRNA A-37 threonylcarbamoyl transferase component Bud32